MFIVLLLLSVVWYWFDAMKAKEIARHRAGEACKSSNLVFLDETVAISKLWPRRNHLGQMSLYREYQFEFTSDGEFRYQGKITMLGKRVLSVDMDVFRMP